MRPIDDLEALAATASHERFRQAHPEDVIVAVGVVDGDLREKAGKALRAATLMHIDGLHAVGSAPPKPPMRPFVRPLWAPIRNGFGVRDVMTVGRLADNDIVIADYTVSKRHATLKPGRGHYLLEDLGSTNGTEVGGTPLKPEQPVQINSGDWVVFGRMLVRVFSARGFYRWLVEVRQAA